MIKNLFFTHVALAYISLGLLLLRGVLSAKTVDWRAYRLLKIAPHAVDTLLLVTGIVIFVMVGYGIQPWILAKLLFLVLYVVFATRAFKKGQRFSLKHFLLAVVSFMLTMLVATIH